MWWVQVKDQLTLHWELATEADKEKLSDLRSRMARKRGVFPEAVYVKRGIRYLLMAAMRYVEEGKWERWSICNVPLPGQHHLELRATWSEMAQYLRPLVGERTVIEVYPREEDTVNTRPFRWFWVVPDGHPPEFDLRDTNG